MVFLPLDSLLWLYNGLVSLDSFKAQRKYFVLNYLVSNNTGSPSGFSCIHINCIIVLVLITISYNKLILNYPDQTSASSNLLLKLPLTLIHVVLPRLLAKLN